MSGMRATASTARLTIEIRHSTTVLILHEKVTELDLGAVHVLTRHSKPRYETSPLQRPMCDDIPDLRREQCWELWQVSLYEMSGV